MDITLRFSSGIYSNSFQDLGLEVLEPLFVFLPQQSLNFLRRGIENLILESWIYDSD